MEKASNSPYSGDGIERQEALLLPDSSSTFPLNDTISSEEYTTDSSDMKPEASPDHVHKKGSSFNAFVNILCLAIGVGSLQLAYIVKQSGWIGTTFIVFAAGIAFLNAVITIKCMYLKPGGGRIVGYHNIGFEAFGNAGYYTITVFNIVNIIGSIGIYVILASNNISDMFAQANVHISPRTLMIASATVMCMPTLFAKTLAETMLVSLIGTLTSVIVTVVVIVMACLYPIRNGENPVGNYTGPISHSAAIPGGFAMALSSVTFAYLGTTIVPHIEGGMRHPEKFNRVFGSALSVIAAIYVVMAATGYWAYGDQTMSPITDNFPKTWPTTLAEICITIHVLFAGPLYLVQMSLEIESGLGILQKKPQAQRVWRMAVRIGSALVILAIAEAIPFFDDVIALVGALTNPVLIYLAPIACYVKLKGWRNCSRTSLVGLALLLAFGMAISGFGLVQTIFDIIKSFKGTK
ncbi:hypothetical protein LPJ79_005195 [Coemansia sp. RSA 1821]|nr:transmembrane amino acid transporter protein-domain-containing protein [Coemansia mojavensis]KAJ1747520.1 hypothetical protein LPJ79_005195 [Coemansia sp. RSA 1821]